MFTRIINNIRSTVKFSFGLLIIVQGIANAQSLILNETHKTHIIGFNDPEIIQLPQEPSLADYERFALKNNPGIKAAYSHWQAAIEKVKVAKGLPYPRISFGYFLENVETAVGPQEYKIGLTQMIPWFGKLKLQGDIQALRAESEFQSLQNAINDLSYKLKNIYYDYYYLARSNDITKQNIDLVQYWEVVVQNKYKTAMVGYGDLIKTQIELIKLQDDLQTKQNKQQPLIANFRSLLNVDSIPYIYVADTLKCDSLMLSEAELEELIFQYNPQLKQLRLQKRVGDLSIRRAKLNYYPDLGIGIDYIATGEKKYTNSNTPVVDSGKDPLVFMVSLSVPLWWGKQKAEVNVARNLRRNAEEQINDIANILKAELSNIIFEMNDARRKVTLYQEQLIPKSLESLKVSEKEYISGKSDFFAMIDAQRIYLQLFLEHERSMVRYQKALAKLEKLVGRKI